MVELVELEKGASPKACKPGEIMRTGEAPLSWSERNYRQVIHSARLGQLCRELEQHGADDVLEIMRAGLLPLWD